MEQGDVAESRSKLDSINAPSTSRHDVSGNKSEREFNIALTTYGTDGTGDVPTLSYHGPGSADVNNDATPIFPEGSCKNTFSFGAGKNSKKARIE